jgi:hypothetical protein
VSFGDRVGGGFGGGSASAFSIMLTELADRCRQDVRGKPVVLPTVWTKSTISDCRYLSCLLHPQLDPSNCARRVMVVTKLMRTSSTRHSKLVAAAVLAVGLAACSEGPTAPLASGGFDRSAALMSSSIDGNGNGGRGQESGARSFTVWPGYPVIERFGDHYLNLPANVVCDPATSGYGQSFWDQPCDLLREPIQVTATWSSVDGRAAISFSPDLRFAPSDDESRWVKLSLKDSKGIDPAKYYTILWYNKESGAWVDEAASDPTLKARPNQSGNLVTRRLKHFSDWELWSDFGSYNVTSGYSDFSLGGGW